MSDGELVLRARQGDELAWEALLQAHQQPVFRFAYLLVGDADEAEDVAQEVFIRAYHSLHRYDTDRPLRPWLLQITTNLARNHRRALSRYVAVLQRWIQTEPAPVIMPQEQSGLAWEAQLLWQAVQRLPHNHQEIIYLRYFLDLGEAEIGAALKLPAGTVKSRLHRAVTRLRMIADSDFPALRMERQL